MKNHIEEIEKALNEENIPDVCLKLQPLAKEKGYEKIAKEVGFNYHSAYKIFSKNGNPLLLTFIRILKSLGLKIKVVKDVDGKS